MNTSLEEINQLIRKHLKSSNVAISDTWTISQSPVGGRGLFASRDLGPGDVIYEDVPLIIGPPTGNQSQPLCAGCHRSDVELVACSRGCGLPVCDERCEDKEQHGYECERLCRWRILRKGDGLSWSLELLRALTPLRCLNLNDEQKKLMMCLEAHTGPLHEQEMKLIMANVDTGPNAEEEEFLRFCCCALDANTFEISFHNNSTPLTNDRATDPPPSKTVLRGLFPLAAMMNHECTANTRLGFNKEMRMFVQASKAIPQGTEITTSYFALLWGTTARRHHLSKTKHFKCFCSRCKDSQEFGTRLSALKCPNGSCPGSLLSRDPVNEGSVWSCDHCALNVSDKKARLIYNSMGAMLRAIDCSNPVQIAAFLRGHHIIFATSNQVVVEMKSTLVWIYGHYPGYKWNELTEAALETKERFCRELLRILERLDAGQCRLRGLFLFELHCTLVEMHRRSIKTDINEVSKAIEEVASMFQNDVTSPPDLWKRLDEWKEENIVTFKD